jgi:hypothetical protein
LGMRPSRARIFTVPMRRRAAAIIAASLRSERNRSLPRSTERLREAGEHGQVARR